MSKKKKKFIYSTMAIFLTVTALVVLITVINGRSSGLSVAFSDLSVDSRSAAGVFWSAATPESESNMLTSLDVSSTSGSIQTNDTLNELMNSHDAFGVGSLDVSIELINSSASEAVVDNVILESEVWDGSRLMRTDGPAPGPIGGEVEKPRMFFNLDESEPVATIEDDVYSDRYFDAREIVVEGNSRTQIVVRLSAFRFAGQVEIRVSWKNSGDRESTTSNMAGGNTVLRLAGICSTSGRTTVSQTNANESIIRQGGSHEDC
ncbi:hypothetical protein [Rhodococcus sp. 077-4]|uniref:hypothetical protein n=1 Tax=Rhodococcus sp. 077-4 TaxID=2789271 RepID=UPI0039F4AFA8